MHRALMFCYCISRLLIIYNRSYLVFPGLELGNLISIADAMSIITCFALLGTWILFFLECHTSEIQDETLFLRSLATLFFLLFGSQSCN